MNHQLIAVDDAEAGFRIEQSGSYKDERRRVAPALPEALTKWLNSVSTVSSTK